MLRPSLLPAVIAASVIAVFGVFVDQQNRQLADQRLRADVLNHVSLLRAKLEGHINSDILIARGLAAAIATEPLMGQARFGELAQNLLGSHSEIRDIAGAPGLVVSLIYPIEGNRKALGLDYARSERQRDTVLRARDTGQMVLAGPLDLVQGGQGFIVRLPVFYNDADGQKVFWGIVSAVIDVDRLYRDSGLLDPALPIDVALVGKDALGAGGVRFFGKAHAVSDDPVTAGVSLSSGSWQIAAVPKKGWDVMPPNTWLLRLAMLAAGILVTVPTFLTGRLLDERRAHLAQLKTREVELERLSRRLELALDTSKVGVWEMDISTGKLVWDGRMNELYGYPEDGGARDYTHWLDRLIPGDAARAKDDFDTAIATRGRYHSEYRLAIGEGKTRVIRAIGSVYTAADGTAKIVGVNWDVTTDVVMREALQRAKAQTDARNAELESARARIEHNSLHDFLTGLPNRMYLDRVLEEHAARCAQTGSGIVLLHIDLDRFKEINDTLGHAAGDAMLVHTAATIRANLSESDFVARIGGDEFVIVSTADEGLPAAKALARRLIHDMQKPVFYEGHECRFGVSIGIAEAEGEAVDRQSLPVNADIALYRAKNRGRNCFEIFTAALQAEIVARREVADSILKGLEERAFIPYFQPQFDARTFEMVGVEALARWRHPTRGIVKPSEFVQIAEEINVLATIDQTILEQGLAQFHRWREAGLHLQRLSVNVSSRRLHDERLIDTLRGLQFERGMLAFELVESIYLDESDDLVLANTQQLETLGIDVEIDDFGTGYASIVSLMRLKPRRLKIDRQLVLPIVRSQTQRHLVQSIVDIGKALGIEIVAEGVETLEHARLLRGLGCDVLQGFAFAKPMPAEELLRFARRQPRLAVS